LFVTAQLELPEQRTVLLVPQSAVQKLGEVARVFVVREDAAREQVVALGEASHEKVEIKAGLHGEELLLARPELAHDGDVLHR
jgi:multidrug efflux pump subunit AcrA (membrane-fusion protein)